MIIVQTPLRISLFGGGTDFPGYFHERGGCVLSTAIDKYIYVTVKSRFDDLIRVGYTKTEMVGSIDEVQHELIREALRLTNVKSGVEITTMGDIPSEGSGLGSSSTVTVGALHALNAYQRSLITSRRLAEEAITIELDILKAPIGWQDQYIAAYGGFRLLWFGQHEAVDVLPVDGRSDDLKRLNDNLMLLYTGITRKSSTVLNEQVNNIKHKYAVLDELKGFVHEANACIVSGDVDEIGRLLHESWQLKKSLASRVSNPEIDTLYRRALLAGAIGGKIAGAGGGGFLLLYCPYEKQQEAKDALQLKELPFNINAPGTKVIFDYQR